MSQSWGSAEWFPLCLESQLLFQMECSFGLHPRLLAVGLDECNSLLHEGVDQAPLQSAG
jgi:hypothetical protein